MRFRRPSRIAGALLLVGSAGVVACPAGADDLLEAPAAEDTGGAPAGTGDPAFDLALRYRTVFAIGANDDPDLAGLVAGLIPNGADGDRRAA